MVLQYAVVLQIFETLQGLVSSQNLPWTSLVLAKILFCIACKDGILGLIGGAFGSSAAAAGSSGTPPGGDPGAEDILESLATDVAVDQGLSAAESAAATAAGEGAGRGATGVLGVLYTAVAGTQTLFEGMRAIHSSGGRGLGGASRGAQQSMEAAMNEIHNRPAGDVD